MAKKKTPKAPAKVKTLRAVSVKAVSVKGVSVKAATVAKVAR